MAILCVEVNGKKYVVQAHNKGTAKAWGRGKLDVTVEEASAEDITEFLLAGGEIEKLEPAPKKDAAAEGDAPVAEADAAE